MLKEVTNDANSSGVSQFNSYLIIAERYQIQNESLPCSSNNQNVHPQEVKDGCYLLKLSGA